MEICKREVCTGCGACSFVCPKNCITMDENSIGIVYPNIEIDKCINCGACKKICPQINPVSLLDTEKAYAAWSSDAETRRTSASGGIAAEIYQLALEKNYYVAGAVSNEDFSVSMKLTDSLKEIEFFKNSKYVFSTAYDLFEQLKVCVKNDRKAVVIGLPCQIAAIKKLFKNYSNFLLIDVVCHGTTPVLYLQQHIQKIESGLEDKVEKMSFRDPNPGTYTYTFTLYNKQKECIYKQRLADGDTYQYGYHRWITYRENCYHCQFAQKERCSDITLGDYKGLGKIEPCSYDERKVSCVLIHTKQGEEWLDELIEKKRIIAEIRPIEEPINGDSQLRHPTVKTSARGDFEKEIKKSQGDFESAIAVVIKNEKRRKRWSYLLIPLRIVKRFLLK